MVDLINFKFSSKHTDTKDRKEAVFSATNQLPITKQFLIVYLKCTYKEKQFMDIFIPQCTLVQV